MGRVAERDAEAMGANSEAEDCKQAVVRKRGEDGHTQTAVFDIRGAREKAGDWITTVRKDLERRFRKVEVLQTQENGEAQHKKDQIEQKAESKQKKKNMFDKMGKGLENIHPLHVMNENMKDKIKETAMSNRRKIAALLVEASLYCVAFEGAKRGLKKVTRHRKYTGRTVAFISDYAFPNGLYGPIFGFLIRLTLPF